MSFDLMDLLSDEKPLLDEVDNDGIQELEEWAATAVEPNKTEPLTAIFDIETGPLEEDRLKAIYREKSYDEFAESCDQRWKEETKKSKYEEYKVTAWRQFVDKAALSPITGRVLAIGILQGDAVEFLCEKPGMPLTGNHVEEYLLNCFWTRIRSLIESKQPIIGHNSNSFDLPFLVRRSWLIGVRVPREIRQGRYWNPLFQDTMEVWGCGQREFISLNTLGEIFDCGQKTEGVCGADFHKLWAGTLEGKGTPEEQRNLALEYLGQDLRLTQRIAEKLGMI